MISEIIEKWIKGILIDGITGNLSGLFDNVNAKVGEIASDVGSTPQAWNSGIFNMLRSLSETVVLPIAAAILALVMCHELIQMITEKNNMHDFDTSMFFRWIFKSAFAILIVSNTWNIVMGVFDATQSVVNQSSGVIIGETSIHFDRLIPGLEFQLESMTIGSLLSLWFQTLVVGLTMNILSICIFLVTYTLLSAMERAGAEDMPEEAERKGLGTPATRAAILEKLVQMGFVQRKGKQLVPTKDGINLAVVLPESLTSPALTAEWENRLTEIAKGKADPDEFMAEIEAQVRQLVKTYSCISADKQNLFQSERVIIGKCPRCSENVYEGKKNFYCGNRSCQFVMWKNDRFFEQRKKAFTPKIAAALLKNGKAKVKGLYSEKTGKTYDATVLLADTGGKYVNYRVERKE